VHHLTTYSLGYRLTCAPTHYLITLASSILDIYSLKSLTCFRCWLAAPVSFDLNVCTRADRGACMHMRRYPGGKVVFNQPGELLVGAVLCGKWEIDQYVTRLLRHPFATSPVCYVAPYLRHASHAAKFVLFGARHNCNATSNPYTLLG
jgi:hypothetical protein